jgi:hypothetical protein
MSMDAKARKALSVIRKCVEAERFTLLSHFTQRMDSRSLVWPDVLAVLDNPADARDGGPDRFDRPKWIVLGTSADGLPIEVVCVLDEDERGNVAVFVTIY